MALHPPEGTEGCPTRQEGPLPAKVSANWVTVLTSFSMFSLERVKKGKGGAQRKKECLSYPRAPPPSK